MQKDFVINKLIHSAAFAKKVAISAGAEGGDALTLTLHDLPDGQYKIAYRLEAGDSVNLAVKETRFYGTQAGDREYGHPVESWDMDVFSASHAIYELRTAQIIAKAPIQEARYFPVHKADFSYIHPEFDGYTGEPIGGGKFTTIAKAREMLDDHFGASFLTVDEFIKGRAPNDEELMAAHRLRAEGMKRNPRLWLTVDVDRDDVIVRPSGDLVFIDLGNFKGSSPDESKMLAQFMREDEHKTPKRPSAIKTKKYPDRKSEA